MHYMLGSDDSLIHVMEIDLVVGGFDDGLWS